MDKSDKKKDGGRVNTEGNCIAGIYTSLAQLKIMSLIMHRMIEENIQSTKTSTKKFSVNKVRCALKKMKNVSDKILFELDDTILDTRGQFIVKYLVSSYLKKLNHDKLEGAEYSSFSSLEKE